MFPRIQFLFNSITDKRSHAESTENRITNITIIPEQITEEDLSDTSGSEIEEIELKAEHLERETTLQSVSHSDICSCVNCDEVLSKFSECSICLEPLQGCGPCVCPWCGGFWCLRCSRKLSKCAWCRGFLRAPAGPCLALQRLVNTLMLPCRNYKRGCKELLTLQTRFKHQCECKFDAMICPLDENCALLQFEDLVAHLHEKHHAMAAYSLKIRILIEDVLNKLNNSAYTKNKYKIILLHEKNAFITKVSIYKYHIHVEVKRLCLGYMAEERVDQRKSEYFAAIEFQCKTIYTKQAVGVDKNIYSKRVSLRWHEENTEEVDESITIHVGISKNEPELTRTQHAVQIQGNV